MTVELRHLRCFLAIAEELNFTRAAARLHLSQPALSRALNQLEQHLSARLVDRSTHHVELTVAGEEFKTRAAAAISAFELATAPVRDGVAPLRVGYAWSALGAATPTLLRTWSVRFPGVAFKLLRSDDRHAGLEHSLVDAALVRGSLAEHESWAAKGWSSALVTVEARVAAVPADSSLAGRGDLTLADLVDRVVALNPVSGSTSLDLWPESDRPHRTIEVGNTDDWLMMIASGGAVGVTSTATAQLYRQPGIAYVPLSDAPGMPVHLLWPGTVSHPSIPQLLALIKELLADQAPGVESTARLEV